MSSIEKSLNPMPAGLDLLEPGPDIEVVVDGDGTEDDGSTIVDLSGEGVPTKIKEDAPFDANLAEYLEPQYLLRLGGDLYEDVESDLRSRSEWEETFTKGLRLLGLKIEENSEPWEGACGIVHPLLAEACMRFQAEAISETFPAQGPVKTKILGLITKEKEEAAARVRDDMNNELTDVMTEYRMEHERLLWNLPIAGSALKKIYYDARIGRQTSMFVGAEDFIVSYGTTDLATCPRYTHRFKYTPNDFKKLQVAGVYSDIDLGDPMEDETDIETEKNEINGASTPVTALHHTFYEVHVELDLEGFEDPLGIAMPYTVTIDKSTQKVVGVYRNWDEEDQARKKRDYFAHYQYIPGFGFYGLGLIHLVGGFAEGATSILRQLVDAGTLSNLPGGLKTRGLRITGDDDPIGPGEWRDVDVPGGTLKENLLPLPYKEPSVVLAGLLEKIVEEGRKFAAVAEMKVSDFDSNSPVGTTMALLERTLKVMSAVQARVYAAMKTEFKLLKVLITKHGSKEYTYEPESGDKTTRFADYAMVDLLPVADPNSATMSQRIVQWQAVMQLAAMAPQIYDLPELHAQMLEILGVKNIDKLIPSRAAKPVPTDPVTENMNIMNGKPVKAFLTQDHKAHIAVHQAAMEDPKIMQMIGQNPMAQQIQGAAMAHLMEHVAYEYRLQMEKTMGAQLPPEGQPVPPEIENQLSGLIAAAAPKLLGINTEEQAAKQAEAAQKDPVAQAQLIDSQVALGELELKKDKAEKDRQLELARLKQKDEQDKRMAQIEILRINTQSAAQGANIGATAAAKNEERRLKAEMQEKEHEFQAGSKIVDMAGKGIETVAKQKHESQKQDKDLTAKESAEAKKPKGEES